MDTERANDPPQALAALRVLEVAERVCGPYGGKLLASLGAEVIKAEAPPEGDPSRRRGPFPGDIPHPKRSGTFLYLNTGKKDITLNLADPQGRVLLGELARCVDVIIHDQPPARAAAWGLDAASLSQSNLNLIVAALTPFGNTGPYADYRAYDITVFHAGGEGYLLPNGLALDTFPDRAPIVAGSQMGSYQAGLTAAVGVLAAVYARRIGTSGQTVDASSQEAQLALGYIPIQRLESEGVIENRFARYFRVGGVMPAQDGYIELLTLEPRQWENLIEFLGHPDWATPEMFGDPARYGPELNRYLREWFSQHPKAWLYHEGQAHGVPLAPYLTPAEVFHSPQQRARGLFIAVDHPQAGPYDYAGLPFRFSETPPQTGRAPLLGEHNRLIYQELGYSPQDIVALARAGAI
ncbi:MAG: CoA transferase [Deltaproteobacteria bacterium]|nr:CoA transferase [Deltaproteobacteria bacterium]